MADEVRKFFEIFVKEGNVVLHRAIKSFKMSDTVVDALHSIDPKLIDKEHLLVKGSKAAGEDSSDIELSCPIRVLSQFGFHIISFILPDPRHAATPRAPQSERNINTVLMAKGLPPPCEIGGRGSKPKLYNDLLEILRQDGILFQKTIIDTVGKKVMNTLVDVLFYLDPHHGRLLSRGCHIPRRFSTLQHYNDWKAKKQKEPKVGNLRPFGNGDSQ